VSDWIDVERAEALKEEWLMGAQTDELAVRLKRFEKIAGAQDGFDEVRRFATLRIVRRLMLGHKGIL